MNEVTIFLLLFAQCFPVTSSQGGNRSVHLFFCKIPGCASNVTNVFCNDKSLFVGTGIADCTGLPPPDTVCQHDGHTFVRIDREGSCEFEGNDGHIETNKCTDHSDICAFIIATTSSPVTTKDNTGYIVGGLCGLLLLILLGLVLYFWNKRRNRATAI